MRPTNPGTDTIDSKLEAFSVGILTRVTELMDKKLGTLKINSQHTNQPMHDSDQSMEQKALHQSPTAWSIVASQPPDMKAVLRDARNDEKLEESGKQKRAKNIIIHGTEEVGQAPGEIKKEDEEYIKSIFTKIRVEVTTAAAMRLGEVIDGNQNRQKN